MQLIDVTDSQELVRSLLCDMHVWLHVLKVSRRIRGEIAGLSVQLDVKPTKLVLSKAIKVSLQVLVVFARTWVCARK